MDEGFSRKTLADDTWDVLWFITEIQWRGVSP